MRRLALLKRGGPGISPDRQRLSAVTEESSQPPRYVELRRGGSVPRDAGWSLTGPVSQKFSSPKDPSATRAVGVSAVDEITQRARPVNSAAWALWGRSQAHKRPREHANAWCCGIQRTSTKCLPQRHHRCVPEDAAQELPNQHTACRLGAAQRARAVAAR